MFERILHANDGSEGAMKALGAALDLARRHHAELHMICVEELPSFPATMDEVREERMEAQHRFTQVIARAEALAKGQRVRLHAHVLAGHPVRVITEFAREQRTDLLVTGFMGHSALYNRVIGSTTDRLVDLAPCSVLVVK
ncbi:universal stress protein [Crenalkalicoccus roseus]|uniref:universal stress protein n=1 Tax=Crenalkalicoccus roseus TaxID=1485588 RepID=UPI00107FF6E2|nr:universal stress protein [Crenalkalicoccus roseus]